MIEVKVHLYDAWERGAFGAVMDAIDRRRMALQEQAQAQHTSTQPAPTVIEAEPVTGQHSPEVEMTDENGGVDESVIAAITPAGVQIADPHGRVAALAVPTLAELTTAIQTAIGSSPVPAQVASVKALLGEYGAKTVGEVPENKRAELIGRLK